ncbi:MAG: CatB-related O-acetyltransferase [Parachlamydiales bacterium]|jgi:virginiamycin A acetyltransferase
MNGPDPEAKYPFEGLPWKMPDLKRCVFLKNIIKNPKIIVGDYTYYDDPDGCENFESKNVPYLYSFSEEKLIIGKFCALAAKTTFITSSANHKLDGFSTYPFGIMGHGWEKHTPKGQYSNKGDTVVGNDVWFGYASTVLPGVRIGDGAIIAAKAVVSRNVPAYAVAAGNPARIVKRRFDDHTIAELLKIKWWDWPLEKITANIRHIIGFNLEKLKNPD